MGNPTKLRHINKLEIVQKYHETKSLKETAEFYNVDVMAINYHLHKFNVERYPYDGHKYKCNPTVFSVIDNEEAAYWIGFLAADGSLLKDKPNKVTLTLARKDREHITKFKAFLGAENPVLDYERNQSKSSLVKGSGPISSLAIDNPQIAADLRSLGFSHDKTYSLKPPSGDQVPKHLLKHYWRGMIDGDGWLCYNPDKGYCSIILGLCGTKEICEGFKQFFNDNGCTLNPSPRHNKQSKSNYSIEIKGFKEVSNVLTLLYSGATVFLDRKYDKALQIIDSKPLPWGSTTGKRT